MILFFKHILRSIRRAPMQPLLICLTVLLAVALSVTTVSLSDMFVANAQAKSTVNAELGDILITPRSNSASRLLFVEDTEEILGDQAQALGSFQLSCFLDDGKTVLSVSALDLLAADSFYRFSFVEYGRFTTQNLHTSAIISSTMAAEHHLSVGDSFTMRLLERDFVYTVEAIAENTGALAQSDVLISIGGIRQALSELIPAVASLGDSFFPYTRLMIKLQPGADAQALLARLSEDARFSDKNISHTANQALFDYLVMVQLVFVWICLLILMLLCGFLINSSLTLLHQRRGREYLAFANAGASPRRINALLFSESMLYALIGSIPGLLLAYPCVYWAGRIYESQAISPKVTWPGMLIGLLLAPLLMLLCTLSYLFKQRKESRSHGEQGSSRTHKFVFIAPVACTLAALLALILLPIAYSYLAASALVLCCTWLLFCLAPPLLKCVAAAIEKTLDGRKRPWACVVLACKSVKNRVCVRYVGRLIAVFCALSITLLTCQQLLDRQTATMSEDLPFEMLITNATPPVLQGVALDPGVAGSMDLLYIPGTELPNDATAIAISISGDVSLCMPKAFLPQKIPTGREVALSVGLCERTGISVGDEITVTIEGVSHTFVVSEQLAINEPFLFFDADHIGLVRDMLCVRLQDADDQAARERIIGIAEINASAVVKPQYAFGTIPETLSSHIRIMKAALGAALLAGMVAVLNIAVAEYRERERERKILHLCGISRATSLGAMLAEVLLVGAFSLLLGAFFGGVITLCMDCGVRSFGMVLIL